MPSRRTSTLGGRSPKSQRARFSRVNGVFGMLAKLSRAATPSCFRTAFKSRPVARVLRSWSITRKFMCR